jgi:hypothetical protein
VYIAIEAGDLKQIPEEEFRFSAFLLEADKPKVPEQDRWSCACDESEDDVCAATPAERGNELH